MFDGVVHPFLEPRGTGTFKYQDAERFTNCEGHPYGIFFDLTDDPTVELSENWDNIGGFTYGQLYNFLGEKDKSLCNFIGIRIAPICVLNGTFDELFEMV